MNFNDLLPKNISPENVIIFRHRPSEPKLMKEFPRLAADFPNVFNAYQQTQSSTRVENSLKRLIGKDSYVASFIGLEPGRAVFVALYQIRSSKSLTPKEFADIPEYIEIERLGGSFWFTEKMVTEGRSTVEWFDLVATDFYSEWKGRLVVEWPKPERVWCRRAQNNDLKVLFINEQSLFDEPKPKWRDIDLSWEDLKYLSPFLKQCLSQWRGIYLIFDVHKHQGYVGSAYGADNLLGRWQNYKQTGHGGNKLLHDRSPENFRFTILELVSPEMGQEEIIPIESNWKKRLHTRHPYGLNDN